MIQFNCVNVPLMLESCSRRPNFYLYFVIILDRLETIGHKIKAFTYKPDHLPRLASLAKDIPTRYIVMLELQRYLNFTPVLLKFRGEADNLLDRNVIDIFSTIFVPETFGLFIEQTDYIDTFQTARLTYREDAICILYCVKNNVMYTPSALTEIVFRAFDTTTWVCLLVALISCGVVVKATKIGKCAWFDVVSIVFRQPVDPFSMIHLTLTAAMIIVLFFYEGDTTTMVIKPLEPKIFKNFEEIVNNKYYVQTEVENITERAVPAHPLVDEKIVNSSVYEEYLENEKRFRATLERLSIGGNSGTTV